MHPTAALGVLTLQGEIYTQLQQALARAEAAEQRVRELEGVLADHAQAVERVPRSS